MSDFDVVEKWLSWKLMNQNKAESTIVKYRYYLRHLADFLHQQRKRKILEASSDDLLLFTGLHMHEKGLSPRSRRALVAAVKGFYQWALKNRLIRHDVTHEMEYPNAGLRLPDVATLHTAEKLMMAPDISTLMGIRDCAIIAILTGCGLRVSGLTSLNESSLQWTKIDGKDRLVIKTNEKGNKDRLIPAPQDIWLLIRAYLGHPDLRAIDRTLPNGDQVLFVSLNNRSISPDKYHGEARRIHPKSVDSMIKKYGRKLGLPEQHLHAHAFRHLFGTELAEEGVSIREIQELMGHKDIKNTQIYTQLAIRRLSRTMDSKGPLSKLRTPISELANYLGD